MQIFNFLKRAVLAATGGAAMIGTPTKTNLGSATTVEAALVSIDTFVATAVSQSYVDAAIAGLDWKMSVRAATTANITLSGAQTIDGVSVIAGDRVLVKNQTTASENGIYVCAAGTWARSADANASAEVTGGMACYVTEGTTLADTGWVLTTNDPISLGTTALAFAQFGGSGGSVTSVGATSPLNSTGGSSPTISIADQAANIVLAGPTGGGSAAPGFRALVAADIPNLAASVITSGTLALARGGAAADLSGTGPGFLKQATLGSVVTVAALAAGDIPNLAATILTSAVVATARLGSGTADNTTFLRGDQAWTTVTAVSPTLYTATDGATVTFNLSNSVSQIVTLGGNRTLAVSNDSGNVVFDVQLKQDGTGSRTVTWFSGITWPGGTPPTLTTNANKKDWFGFRRTGSNTYDGVVLGTNM